MQIVHIFAAYDRKAEVYLPVFQQRSDAEAVRAFTEAVTSSDTPLSRYPADFDLIRLASLNIETGEVTPQWPVGLVINGFVALQAAQHERARYAKAINTQVDLEDLLAEES